MFFLLSHLSLGAGTTIDQCGDKVTCTYEGTKLTINEQDAGGKIFGAAAFNSIKDTITELEITDVDVIGTNAFKGFSKLERIRITMLSGSLTSIEANAFAECPKISFIVYAGKSGPTDAVSGLDAKLNVFVTGAYTSETFAGLKAIKIEGEFGTAVQDISNHKVMWRFAPVTETLTLLPVTGNDGFMEPIDGASPFEEIKLLTKHVVIQNLMMISRNAFKGFTELVSVDIQSAKFTAIMESAFEGCTKLPTFTIPATIIESNFKPDAFKGCTGLESITYLGTSENLEVFSNAAEKPQNLKKAYVTVNYPGNKFWGIPITYKGEYGAVKKVTWELEKGTGKFTITNGKDNADGEYEEKDPEVAWPFQEKMSFIKEIVISADIKHIGKKSFKGFINLEKVTFLAPAKVTATETPGKAAITIGEYAFSNCNKLNSVTLPEEGLTEISASVFEYCTALKELVIPASVTKIGNGAFKSSGLEKITYMGTEDFSNLKNAGIPENANVFVTEEYKHGKFGDKSVTLIGAEPAAPGEEDPKGLGAGAIAGIVIAVLVAVAAVGFCVYWFVLRPKPAVENEEKGNEDQKEGKEGEFYVPKEAEN